MTIPADDNLLARYLLGELTEPAKARIEKQVLGDDTTFDRLLSAEDDLIDAYVRDELSAGERQRFEARFLVSTERRARVEFARTLKARVDEPAAELCPPELARRRAARLPWWPRLARALAMPRPRLPLALAASLLVVVAATWLAGRGGEHERRLAEQPAAPRPLVVAFVLAPGSRGAAGPPRLSLPPEAETVELQLDLEGVEGYSRFRARLLSLAGEQIWSRSDLEAVVVELGSSVALAVPAAVLRQGHYVLTLEGFPPSGRPEEIAVYDFEVS